MLASDLDFLKDTKIWTEHGKLKNVLGEPKRIDFRFDFNALFRDPLDLTNAHESERLLDGYVVAKILEDPLNFETSYQIGQQKIQEELMLNIQKFEQAQEAVI